MLAHPCFSVQFEPTTGHVPVVACCNAVWTCNRGPAEFMSDNALLINASFISNNSLLIEMRIAAHAHRTICLVVCATSARLNQ